MIITATFPLPPSVNSAYGNAPGKRRFKSRSYKTWLESQIEIKANCYNVNKPIKIKYTMFFPDKRTRDLSNYIKIIDDWLVKNSYLSDDDHRIIVEGTFCFGGYDKLNPRVEVAIWEV